MRRAIGIGDPRLKWHRPLPPRHFAVSTRARIEGLGRQNQLRLPGPDQIDIDLGQKFGVEQRAVFGAAGIVDRIARAEVVEAVRHARMLASRQQKRVDQPFPRNRRPFDAIKLGIDKADIERRVVDHQRRIANELQKFLDHLREQRFVGEELAGKTMHGECFSRHVALGIEMPMKGLAGRHPVENLDTADFNQPVAAQRVEARGFGIENDFAHQLQAAGNDEEVMTNQDRRCGILTASLRMSRIRARTGSRPCEVSTTKSARLRFSASGSCRARMASSFSLVILSRARMR